MPYMFCYKYLRWVEPFSPSCVGVTVLMPFAALPESLTTYSLPQPSASNSLPEPADISGLEWGLTMGEKTWELAYSLHSFCHLQVLVWD